MARELLSPLRYPGGKGKMADVFKRIIEQNDLLDGIYVEPFVGGGSVALSLLLNDYVSRIVINDKDRSIYAFWHSVLNDASQLCRMIADTPVDMDVWRQQKEVQAHKDDAGLLELGFSTFFLNRTNRSGIIKAGVIGGNGQTGNYLIDARFNKSDLIARIQRIADYADRIELHNEDAVALLNNICGTMPNRTLYYLDPPYYVKGPGLYMNYFKDDDHRKIATAVAGITHGKWIVTYDNHPFIASLYSRYRQREFSLSYSTTNGKQGEEIMIYSDNLKEVEI
ncbi:MAG: DNA adenine methylase [Prevotella sp.]